MIVKQSKQLPGLAGEFLHRYAHDTASKLQLRLRSEWLGGNIYIPLPELFQLFFYPADIGH